MKNKSKRWPEEVAIENAEILSVLIENHRNNLLERIEASILNNFAVRKESFSIQVSRIQEAITLKKIATEVARTKKNSLKNKGMEVRKSVRIASSVTDELKKAFTIDVLVGNSYIEIINFINTLLSSYETYKAWANANGILQKDIDIMIEEKDHIYQFVQNQKKEVIEKKDSIRKKNEAQLEVEQLIVYISKEGEKVFNNINPTIAAQFADISKYKRYNAKKSTDKSKNPKPAPNGTNNTTGNNSKDNTTSGSGAASNPKPESGAANQKPSSENTEGKANKAPETSQDSANTTNQNENTAGAANTKAENTEGKDQSASTAPQAADTENAGQAPTQNPSTPASEDSNKPSPNTSNEKV